MISLLKGKLERVLTNFVIIDCNGVGYGVNVPSSICEKLTEIDSEISMEIFTYMKENILDLYGFNTRTEKELFVTLISVSGVGPKVAMAILGKFSANNTIGFIKNGDSSSLTQVSGIGKKVAERLCLELNKKIDKIFLGDFIPLENTTKSSVPNSKKDEAVSALVNLGYKKNQAIVSVDSAIKELGEDADTSEIIRSTFRFL